MRILTFIILFLLLKYAAYTQLTIKGNVKSINGLPVSNASVTLHKNNQQQILAFAITDSKGNCTITWQNPVLTDSLHLTVSTIGYGKQTISFFPQLQNSFSFILSPHAIELPSITVKNSPLKLRGDTLNYDAKSFSQKQDIVIGDIIKRLPGVEVSSGGQIKYNGKPITNYYIEGLDLLEDKYSIANNNIPAGAVDQVQILENHQPIRALDSFAFSDRAALNIKLKANAKLRVIGRAKAGGGISNSSLLWDNEAVPMMFKKRSQFIDTYKGNNAGINNLKELTQQNIMDYINAIENNASKNDLLSSPSPQLPTIAEQRYSFNNSNMVSINHLAPLSRFYQMRLNMDYVNDHQAQNSSTFTKFYLPFDTIVINEGLHTITNLNLLQGNVTVTANTPKFYLKNMTKFQGWWQNESSDLVTNNSSFQKLKNPFFNISNDFKIIKVKSKYIVEYSSYTGNTSVPQSLEILPGLYQPIFNNGNPYQLLQQDAKLQSFYTDNYISIKRKTGKVSADHKIGFNVQSQYFYSSLFKTDQNIKYFLADSFENHLHWNRYRIYNENQWSYDNTKLRLTFTLPVIYNHLHYNDTFLNRSNNANKLFINPGATILYYFSPFWNINFSTSYNDRFGDIANVSEGFVLRSYRNLFNNNIPLAEIKSGNIYANLIYRNPLKITFFNLGVSLSKSKSNLLYSQQFYNNLETVKGILQDNKRFNSKVFARYSKYIISLKTSASLGFDYSRSSSQQIQQSRLSDLINQNISLKTNLSSKISSKFTAAYAANYSIYYSKLQLQQSSSSVNTFNQSLTFNVFPTDEMILRISGEHYNIPQKYNQNKNYLFGDVSARYKLKKTKLDFELSCQNLFNTKNFTTVSFLNNIEVISDYQIRPLQILAKVYFTF